MKAKKFLAILLTLCMLLSALPITGIAGSADTGIWDGSADTAWYTADTTLTAYHISTAEQLAGLAQLVNSGTTFSTSVTIYLDNDLYLNDLSDFANWQTTAPTNKWTSIGSSSYSFKGNFDGQSHVVYGLYQTPSADFNGLFGVSDGGSIQNFSIKNSLVKVSGEIKISSVIGSKIGGSVLDIYSDAIIVDTAARSATKDGTVGGIIGEVNSTAVTMARCGFTGSISYVNKVDTNKTYRIGGVIGYVGTGLTMTDCFNTGTINAGSNKAATGGVIAYVNSGSVTVRRCYNAGTVLGGSYHTGGVFGSVQNSDAVVSQCYNTGSVSNTAGTEVVGGVSGYFKGKMSYCYNTGTITNIGTNGTGGVVGYINDSNSYIQYSYNAGTVTGGNPSAIVNHKSLSASSVGDYYLAGSATRGMYNMNNSTADISYTATSCANANVLTLMMQYYDSGYFVADTYNINNGFPVLVWQNTATDAMVATTVDSQIANIVDETSLQIAYMFYLSASDTAKASITQKDDLMNAVLSIYGQSVYDVMMAIDAIGNVSYKSEDAITAAQTAYAALSAGEQVKVLNASVLATAQTDYQSILDGFSYTITGTPGQNSKVPQTWVYNQTSAEWTASRAAAVDEIKYQYYNGLNIGFTVGATKSSWSTWMDGSYFLEMTDKPNDNVEHPYDNNGRCWATISVPFSGMAFSCAGYFAEDYGFSDAPLSDSFEYNGKMYQITWKTTRSYTTTEPYNYAPAVSITSSGYYPGSGTYSSVIGNAFRYAYAKYNMDNKWNDVVLGIPDGDAQKASGDIYYQKYYGPNGDAYLLTTSSKAAIGTSVTVDSSTTAAVYEAALAQTTYTVSGDLAAAISAESDLFSKCGDLVSVSDTAIVFSNGTLTASGYTKSDSAVAQEVIDQINALPDTITTADANAITATEAAYAALNDTQKALVTNYSDLQAARTAYNLLITPANYAAYNALVATIPSDLSLYTDSTVAALNNVTASADLGKMADEQAYVDNLTSQLSQAISGLVLKTLEMNITISEGMVVESSTTSGKYDITWNATIIPGTSTTIADINSVAGVKFISYGVYYATSETELQSFLDGTATAEARQKVFASGTDIPVYTMFGFRLKNVSAAKTRTAMFYLQYEYNGTTYSVFSPVNTATTSES